MERRGGKYHNPRKKFVNARKNHANREKFQVRITGNESPLNRVKIPSAIVKKGRGHANETCIPIVSPHSPTQRHRNGQRSHNFQSQKHQRLQNRKPDVPNRKHRALPTQQRHHMKVANDSKETLQICVPAEQIMDDHPNHAIKNVKDSRIRETVIISKLASEIVDFPSYDACARIK